MQSKRFVPITTLVIGGMYSTVGYAHVGDHATSGLQAGLLHPLTGIDHLAATVAVAVLAGRHGGHAAWAIPAGFMALMLAATSAAVSGFSVAGAEVGILLSVAAVGLLLVARRWGSLPLVVGVTAFTALAHGYIHGSEMPVAELASFMGGLTLTTTALMIVGVLIGRARACRPATRVAGGAFAAAAIVAGV